jgi:YesN/AraC family two-component response regulator
LDNVNDVLELYYGDSFSEKGGLPSVTFVAEQVFLSPKYMSDLLKKETGYHAQETIHNFILKLAKHRLLSSNKSIAEISYSLGFEYPQYFSKIFKNKTGMTPIAFRNVH